MKKILLPYWVIIGVVLLMSSCQQERTVAIGFTSALTGPLSGFGQDIREGTLMAVDDLSHDENLTISLEVLDNGGSSAKALEQIQYFQDKGIQVITGIPVSTMALNLLPYLTEQNMILLGSTLSSPLFEGKDDALFRVSSSADRESRILAEVLWDRDIRGQVVVILDSNNLAYTEPWYQHFTTRYTQLGGTVKDPVYFRKGEGSYRDTVEKALENTPDPVALCVITNPIDAASLTQAFKEKASDTAVITGGWANNQDLITYGGQSVEGILFTEMVDTRDKDPQFQEFSRRYKNRFSRNPSFASIQAYEAILYLHRALQIQKNQEPLKEALKRVKEVQGLQGTLKMNRYGDIARTQFISTVREGEFITIDRRDP